MLSLYCQRCLLLLLLFVPTLEATENSSLEAMINDMFPSATVIGEKTTNEAVPAWPVYQLSELIGYAFESNDMVDFAGFSGERINLLIGIDTAGELAGVKLLHHHEPIFMHGLGPQPLLDFLGQYTGHSVTERIIVGSSRHNRDGANTYFDGVTKATVSVIVANDTILNSALKVARDKLPAYAQKAPVAVREDYFEELDWQQLLSRGLVRAWRTTRQEVEEAMSASLDDFPDPELKLEDGQDHITLYYAFLNPPSIGRNLLGAEQYQRLLDRLRPGEHAFLVMSEGFYGYLPRDYRPGTAPGRISILQNGLPISIRDTNFVENSQLSLAAGAPLLPDRRIFRTRAGAGLNPSQPIQMQLLVDLAKNHLVSQQSHFEDDYILPAEYFRVMEVEEIAKPPPLWHRMWQSRTGPIAVLCAALLVLTIAYTKERKLSANSTAFHWFRAGFLSFTLLFIGFYAQGQLSVVNIFTVQLALVEGLDFEVFLLDPIIFILWIYTFISLFVVGRGLFCGWLCPFGALQEALGWIATRIGLKQIRVAYDTHRRLLKVKYLVLIGLMGVAFYSLGYAEQGAEIEPFKTVITLGMVREWPFVVYALILLGLGLYIHKFYCRYLCPLGAGLAILGKFHLFGWLNRRAECGSPCQLCRHKCEIGAIRKNGEIDYDECIQCLECVVILRDAAQCAPEMKAQRRAAVATQAEPVTWVPEQAPGLSQ